MRENLLINQTNKAGARHISTVKARGRQDVSLLHFLLK